MSTTITVTWIDISSRVHMSAVAEVRDCRLWDRTGRTYILFGGSNVVLTNVKQQQAASSSYRSLNICLRCLIRSLLRYRDWRTVVLWLLTPTHFELFTKPSGHYMYQQV
jgi:hypothetical protein